MVDQKYIINLKNRPFYCIKFNADFKRYRPQQTCVRTNAQLGIQMFFLYNCVINF